MIQVTQYILPNGRKEQIEVERPPEIEALAKRFVDAGGKYEAEILTTGQVSLTAVYPVDGEPQDVVIKIGPNDTGTLDRFDKLVRESVDYLGGKPYRV